MKNINNYISEKLNIKNIKVHQYKYFPKRKGELQLILRERLSKDNNANLNDIDVSDVQLLKHENPISLMFEPN